MASFGCQTRLMMSRYLLLVCVSDRNKIETEGGALLNGLLLGF